MPRLHAPPIWHVPGANWPAAETAAGAIGRGMGVGQPSNKGPWRPRGPRRFGLFVSVSVEKAVKSGDPLHTTPPPITLPSDPPCFGGPEHAASRQPRLRDSDSDDDGEYIPLTGPTPPAPPPKPAGKVSSTKAAPGPAKRPAPFADLEAQTSSPLIAGPNGTPPAGSEPAGPPLTLWDRLRGRKPPAPRTIALSGRQPGRPRVLMGVDDARTARLYPPNKIRNQKYHAYSFLFVVLFNQVAPPWHAQPG